MTSLGILHIIVQEEEIEKAKETMKSTGADHKIWQQICKDFLRGSKSSASSLGGDQEKQ